MCHFPGMLPAAYPPVCPVGQPALVNLETPPAPTTYACQRSSKKEIQHHLRKAKNFKGGNLTKIVANKFKNRKYDSTMIKSPDLWIQNIVKGYEHPMAITIRHPFKQHENIIFGFL